MDKKELLSHIGPMAVKIDEFMREDLKRTKDQLLARILEYTVFNGGKRIRPLLTVISSQLCGKHDDSLYKLAMAYEYLHAATLLHDDVIDHAETRRGKAAANTIWGTNPIILAGDFLHSRSMHLIGCLGGKECLNVICDATAAMVEGEFLQLINAQNFNQSEKDYFEVINGKTAVFLAAVCETGAIYAGADKTITNALHNYGANLGNAFQIIDDLLDYLGTPGKTGKAVGNDFCEGKMTLPLIHTLDAASLADRDFILDLLAGDRTRRNNHIETIQKLFDQYDSIQYSRDKANKMVDNAINTLENVEDRSAGDAKKILIALARYVLSREK